MKYERVVERYVRHEVDPKKASREAKNGKGKKIRILQN